MLDEGLICREFKQAKNKNEQIKILAELNDIDPQIILDILQKNGLISGIQRTLPKKGAPEKKKQKTNALWTPELIDSMVGLLDEGYTNGDIAERLGVDKHSVENKVYSLRKQGIIPKERRQVMPTKAALPKAKQEPIKDEPKAEQTSHIRVADLFNTGRLLQTALENAIVDEAEGVIDALHADYQAGETVIICRVDNCKINISVQIENLSAKASKQLSK